MNPLTYNSHRLLTRWIDLLLDPSLARWHDALHLVGILLGTNLLWTIGLPWLLRKIESLELTPLKAYMLALPATFLYAPLMLTLLSDVFAHAFELKNRWFLLFAIITASQMLTAFYAFVLRHKASDVPIGIESGLAVSLFLLLVSIPATSLMMIINAFAPFM
jgi:hypothetical protein